VKSLRSLLDRAVVLVMGLTVSMSVIMRVKPVVRW
jgi:hypothetical protein